MRKDSIWQQAVKDVPKCALAVLLLAFVVCGCSRNVEWEEEVPLNTGETIWVKRTVKYVLKGGSGNPFDIAYRPSGTRIFEFSYNNKDYLFDGHAGILLIAVSPQRRPVLVAQAEAGAWYARHNYQCTVPFYVQFVPDESGHNWTWPPKIETWLYNMETNLLLEIPKPGQQKRRFTAKEKQELNAPGQALSTARKRIMPAYTGDLCKPKEK